MDAIGANLYAGNDGLFASVLKKNLEPLMAVVRDVVVEPTFPAEELEERGDACPLFGAANARRTLRPSPKWWVVPRCSGEHTPMARSISHGKLVGEGRSDHA